MSNRRFDMYQYRQIIVRLRLGETSRAIARAGLAGRKKVKAILKIARQAGWLDSTKALPEDRELSKFFKEVKVATASTTSLASVHEEQIKQWNAQGIQTTTIHAALQRNHGFLGGYFSVYRLVKKLKGQVVDVSMPLDFKPGECAQVDFGMGPKLVKLDTGELESTWIFVMVLAFSRHAYAEIIWDQRVETWLGCHRRAFEWFGGVPQKVTIDNAKCAITKACYHDPVVQRAYGDFAESYGFMISPCPPYEPKKKGRVESGVKYIKNHFVPLREFRGYVDANEQLKRWLLETAGNRIHGSTREKPLTQFTEIEQGLLKPLPEQPGELAIWAKAKLHGDCHAQFAKCRYSAPYTLVKQILWLRVSETTVRIYQEHTLVALHPRLFKPGSRHTLPEHLPPNGLAYVMQDPAWCLKQAKTVGTHCHALIERLFACAVLDHLRAAQGIVGLKKTYGSLRLNAACHRAIVFDSPSYHTVKSILKKGLEYEKLPTEEAFDALAKTYTGQGRYCRDTSTLLQ